MGGGGGILRRGELRDKQAENRPDDRRNNPALRTVEAVCRVFAHACVRSPVEIGVKMWTSDAMAAPAAMPRTLQP